MLVYKGRLYTALASEKKELKKDYLLQQSVRTQPNWDEIWEEVKKREKDWDKYIEDEALKLHPYCEYYQIGDQVKIPHIDIPDKEVEEKMQQWDPATWDLIKDYREKGQDKEAESYYNRLWAEVYANLDDRCTQEIEDIKTVAEEKVKAEAYSEFRRLRELLRRSDGKDCWRALMVPHKVDPAKLDQLGVYWTQDYEAAQPYYSNRPELWKTHKILIFRGVVDIDYIDWKGTAGARFIEVYGERENEVRFLKHSPIYVHDVEIFADKNNWYKSRKPNDVVSIEAYKRC